MYCEIDLLSLYERAFIRTKRQAKIMHFYYLKEDAIAREGLALVGPFLKSC